MRLARILTPDGPVAGQYEDGVVRADDGAYTVGVDGRLLPPCEPTALYCVGRNYAATLEQMEYERPEEPTFFIKPPASLVAHNTTVPYPAFTEEFTYAGELAAVIDQRCRDVGRERVSDVLRGYTIMNDLDALDQPNLPARKAFDGSARFTLRPGDVVAFGSPANPGLLEPGDEIAITYEGIGALENRIGDPA